MTINTRKPLSMQTSLQYWLMLLLILCLFCVPSFAGLPASGLDSAKLNKENSIGSSAADSHIIDSKPLLTQERWTQLADSVFQHLSNEQGLPHPIVTALAEDGDGFLWVGTQGGLARWDGYRFRRYLADPAKPGALPGNFIQTLHTDRQGKLWVGTLSAGLARYDREQDRFITTTAGPGGLSHVSVRAISDDNNGGVWIGTEGGLDHLDGKTGHVTQLHHLANDETSLPDNVTGAVLQSRDGRLWVGTDKGLVLRSPNQPGFSAVPLTLQSASGVQASVQCLFEDKRGQIWVGTRRHGAFVIEPQTNRVRPVIESDSQTSRLSTEWVVAITEVRDGQIWLGTVGQGIVRIDTATGQTRRHRHDASLPTSLAHDNIWSLLRDRSGLIWVGTLDGLDRNDPASSAILTVFGGTSRPDSISSHDVASIMQAKDGRIWLGFGGNGGVDILDPVSGRVATMRSANANPENTLPKATIPAMVESASGEVWLATLGGLYRANSAASKVTRFNWTQRDASKANYALLPESGKLWIGGRDDGLWSFDPTTAVSSSMGSATRLAEDLTDQRILVFARDSDQTIWLGTRNGLNHFDANGKVLQQIFPNPADPLALASGIISSLLFDQQGRLWVGTLGGGIHLLEKPQTGNSPRFRRIGTAQGLPDANVDQLLEDRNGNIWVSTNAGLAVIDPKKLTVRALARADGVAITSYWAKSGVLTAEGELLFGGAGGLTIVRPEHFKPWGYRPPVVVTEIRVGGESLSEGRFNAQQAGAPLILSPESNSLAVEFAALDYSSPERNRYAYRLEGFDRDWVNTDASRRLAAYTNLPPGDYQLHLRGSNRDGVWTEKELIVAIQVLPSWYQSLWFRLLLSGLTLSAIYGVIRWRTEQLRQQQRKLEALVVQRTTQLREKQQELLDANQGLSQQKLILEAQKQSLLEKTQALEAANADLELSAETLRQLGDVGREITANLEDTAVFDALYRHASQMLNAPSQWIYRLNSQGDALILAFGREDGKPLPGITHRLDSPTSISARSARERTEVLLELSPDDYDPSHIPGTRQMLTVLFVPLLVDHRLLGVMSIQSDQQHAYGERERLIFRTLCAYGAIALANTEAKEQLIQSEKMATLGQLVANVAHEINTPIGAIKSSGSNITESLHDTLNDLPELGKLLSPDQEQLFLGLMHQAFLPAKILSTREERKLHAELVDKLEKLTIDNPYQKASFLIQLHAYNNWEHYLPLLDHAVFEVIYNTASNLVSICNNASNINLAVERVSKIVLALKGFARADQTGEKIDLEIGKALESVLAVYQNQIKQGVELIVNCQTNAVLHCLPDDLNQLWTHLIHNALQAMEYRGKLQISIASEGDQLRLTVSDTGHGIDDSIRSKIFEAFFTTRRAGEGSGLGLFLVKKIVDKHRGKIEIHSQSGIGTQVQIILPVK